MEIETMIISGGGPTSLTTLGVVEYLKKVGYLNNIKKIYATSAGTMIGVLFCLEYDDEIINKYIIERPWSETIKIGIKEIIGFYEKKGILNKEIIKIIFGPLFRGLNIDLEITLKEFYEKYPIELHFITFECNLFKTEDISYLNYPDLLVLDAIMMSSAIPNLFEPIILKKEEKCFIDGGLFSNYPLNIYLESNDKIELNNVLGIKNVYENEKRELIKEETNVIDFMSILLMKILYNNNKEIEIEIPNEVKIPAKSMNMEIFEAIIMNSEIRKKWINDGYKIGELYWNNICQKR